MSKRTTALIVTGVLTTGVLGAAELTPASAASSANPISQRLAQLKNALSGLVSDGTLTQAQADKVASTLDAKLPRRGFGRFGGPGGRMGGRLMRDELAAAAKALGLTDAQLRTDLQGGTSLAAIAKSRNVSVDTLVKALVAVAKDDLAAAVKAGRLTQAQADKISPTLTQRITDQVNRVRPARPAGGPEGAPPPGAPPADNAPPAGNGPPPDGAPMMNG